jgi:hypothetical protein
MQDKSVAQWQPTDAMEMWKSSIFGNNSNKPKFDSRANYKQIKLGEFLPSSSTQKLK